MVTSNSGKGFLSWGASQVARVERNRPANAGDVRDSGLILGSGRFPGEGHDNPLQYSCLENFMDGGAWRTIVHGVAKSWTWQRLTLSLSSYGREENVTGERQLRGFCSSL